MKIYFHKLFFLLLLTVSSGFVKTYSQVIQAETQNGMVKGYSSGEVVIFKGIPFAAPPVGELRWKAPQPVKNWQGVLSCEKFAASPMQSKPVPFMMWTEEFITPPDLLSEDCLYLNVWTPAKSKLDKLPVFVWIYGGGFSSGSAACAVYDGEEMAREGVVFVSLNYRVGVLGFMAHPELSKESENKVSGNYGLLDMVAGLKWIKQNISAFGGDPNRVTIAGQSAGSMAVDALVLSPLSRGLFQGAIAQSGGIISRRFSSDLAGAEKTGLAFMEKLKAANISELRKKSPEDLIQASGNFSMGRFGIVMDGFVIPSDVFAALEKGEFNDVPMIAGWVTGDASLMGNPTGNKDDYAKQSKENYGDRAGDFMKLFPGNSDEEARASLKEINLMQFAALPAYLLSGYMKNKTFIYQFSHIPVDKPGFPNYGAFHTSEVPFALHTLKKWQRSWRTIDSEVEKNMSGYWVNFIKTGTPNSDGLPEWKSYDKNTGCIIEIGDKIVLSPALYKQKLEFLASFVKKTK